MSASATLPPAPPIQVGYQPNAMDDYEAQVANMRPLSAEEAAAASAFLEAQNPEATIYTPPAPEGTPPVAPQPAAPAPAPPADPAAAAPAAAPEADGTEAAPDEGAPAEGGLANNYRISAGGNPLTQRTLAIFKAHQGSGIPLLLSDAEALARKEMGLIPLGTAGDAVTSPAAVPAEAPPVSTSQDDPTIAPLLAREAEIQAQLEEARSNFEEDKEKELQKSLHEATTARITAEVTAKVRADLQTETAKTAWQSAQAASQQAVAAKYGNHWTPDSPLTLVMIGLHADLEAKGDPALNDPNLPLILADRAAAKLGLQSATTPAAPATAPAGNQVFAPQAAPRSTPPVAPIAPGSARSSDPGVPALPTILDLDDYIKTYGVDRV